MKENPNYLPKFDEKKGLEFGIYSLGDHMPNPHTGERKTEQERVLEIIEMGVLAEQAGMDIFVLGESHQEFFVSQAHAVILSAIAQATNKIKISSGSTIISTSDPVRVYENFSTIDLLSNGRAELVAGRASRVGLFKLLGYDLNNYEELFEEKFDLLLEINKDKPINWEGKFRPSLEDALVLPKPLAKRLPIWRAVGGGKGSAIKAGRAGVPMYLAHLGGSAFVYKHTIDAFREAASLEGYNPYEIPITNAGFFYVADTTQEAMREYYPHVNTGMTLANGQGFPKRAFAQAPDSQTILNVGSTQQVIEKILYQHELFGQQRYIAQLDFGGVPHDKIMKNIEIIGNEVLPAIRKYTAKK